jgi:RHS repeat-associated protein
MLKVYFRIFATQLSFVSAIVLLASLTALCQDEKSQYDKGTPPQHVAGVSDIGSYISVDLGTVNLSNGSLNFKIPLGQIGGRGFSIPLTLNYSSKIWSARRGDEFILDLNATRPFAFASYNDPDQFYPLYSNIAPGWGVGAVPVLKAVSNEQAPVHNPSNGCDEFALILNKLTLILPDKGEVQFRDDLTDGKFLNTRGLGTPPCRWRDGYRGARWHATDGSGMIFISDQDDGVSLGNLSGTVIAADGTRYRFIDPNPGALYLLKKSVRCVSITDRNGNQITIQYVPGQVIGQDSVIYTDQLGRQTRIDFNVTDTNGDPLAVRVQLAGYNGAVRYCKIKTDVMNLHYRDGVNPVLPVINGDFDSQGFGYGWQGPHTSLFPNSYGKGAERIDNKKVLTQVILPDSRSLSFAYNEYGEVAEVTLPTGGKIQYDYAHVSALPSGNSAGFEVNPTPPYIGSNVSAIDRAVTVRRAYPDGANLDTTCTYTYTAAIGTGGSATNGMTEVKEVSGSNTLLWNKHYFLDAKRYLTGTGGTGYALWSTGVERRSETLNAAGGIINASEQDWEQRAPVVWTGYTPETQEQPENDNRVKQTRNYLDTGSFARIDTLYDNLNNVRANNVKETLEYDFNQALKRRTVTSYLTANPDNGLINYSTDDIFLLRLPAQQSVYDGGGAERARTVFQYDKYANDGNNATLTDYGPSVTGRDSAYGPSKTTRGNATAVGRWLNTNGSTLFTYSRYDTLGNVISTKDPRGNVTTVSYADNFGAGDNPESGAGGDFGPTFALPTLITSPPPNPGEPQHTAKSQYDFSTGLLTGFKDRNGVVAKTEYNDPFNRPTKIINAKGVTGVETQTAMYYAPQSNPYGVTLARNDVLTARDRDASGDGILRAWTVTDGFGRTTESWMRDPQGDVKVTTVYDGLGRVRQTSNPHRNGETPVFTTTTYDLAGRVTAVTTPDSAGANTAYSGNQVTVTDQAGKKRRSITDALGRLEKVIEDPDGVAYQTDYSYDTLDNLTIVNQGGQFRYFFYDSLKRLTRAKNPEQNSNSSLNLASPPAYNNSWSTAYSYDTNGNLASKTDARNITTTYSYDALNRNTTASYSDSTPGITRTYDTATLGKGRLQKSETAGSAGSRVTINEYDAMGRPKSQSQQFFYLGAWGTSYAMQQTYDLAGAVKTMTYPSNRTVNYSYDNAGRLSSFTGNLGDGQLRTYSTITQYHPGGMIERETFGTQTPLHHKKRYTNRLQLGDLRLSTGSDALSSDRGKLLFLHGPNAVANTDPFANDPTNNGNLVKQLHYVPIAGGGEVIPQADTYTYDALNRNSSVVEPNVFTQAYSYDQWGNRWINSATGGVNNYNPTYDTGSNRIVGPGYDQAGNITSDVLTGGTMTYDAENRLQTASAGGGGTYTYDAHGKRTRRTALGQETWHIYGVGGELLAEYAANAVPSAPQKEYGYRGGQILIIAEIGSGGGTSFVKPASQSGDDIGGQTGPVMDGAADGLFVVDEPVAELEFNGDYGSPAADAQSDKNIETLADGVTMTTTGGYGNAPLFNGIRGELLAEYPAGAAPSAPQNEYGRSGRSIVTVTPQSSSVVNPSSYQTPAPGLGVAVTNPSNTGHGSTFTAANNGAFKEKSCRWSGFQPVSGQITSITLKVDWSDGGSWDGGGANDFILSYSLDNGSSWNTLLWHSLISANDFGTAQVSLPSTQDISLVQVRDRLIAGAPPEGFAVVSATVSGIRLEVETDTTAPAISNVVAQGITTSGATITWSTNENSDSQVVYGETTNYGQSTTLNPALVTAHSQVLSGLAAGTLYHYQVKSKDAAGNLAISTDFAFTTASPPDNTAPVISNVAAGGITTSGATITWNTNENADSQVVYGTTQSYGQSTTLNPALVTAHSQVLSGLAAGMLYYYRVKSKDAAGNLTTSAEFTFTTAQNGSGGIKWLVTDHLGSTRMVIDQTGSLAGIKRHDFLPFGEELFAGVGIRSAALGYGADSTRQKFTGKERDSETSLDFFEARYFASIQGRFTSPDPLYYQVMMAVDPQRFNLYAYARNNPLKFVDPNGERVYVRGDLDFLRTGILYQYAGGQETFDQYFQITDGQVALREGVDISKANAGVQELAGLVNAAENYLFFAGTDGAAAADLFQGARDAKGKLTNEGKSISNSFTCGGNLVAGCGTAVGTTGRYGSKQPANLANGDPVFAVIAYNINAVQTQTATNYGNLSPVPDDVKAAQEAGVGQAVRPVRFFIHESLENREFSRQGAGNFNYANAHAYAIRREAVISRELKMTGGFAGGFMDTRVPKK